MGDAVAVTKAFVPTEAANPSYEYVEGKDGKAVKLSGVYGLKFPDASKLGESYTVSWWMKPDQLGGSFDPTFAAGTFQPEYWINLTFDAKIWSNHGGYIETPAANAYKAGQWQHVAVVVDGSKAGTSDGTVTGTLYVDGKEVSTGNVASGIMTNPGAGLYFGVNAWDAYYQGALDEMLFFNKAMSVSEVQAVAAGKVTAESLNKAETGSNTGTSANQKKAKSVSVKAAGYALKNNKLTLKKGAKAKLSATVSPAKASQKVTYKSSKKKVASVSAKGMIQAKKAGTAKITVKTENGKKKTITVQVVNKAKKNRKLVLKKTAIKLKKGKKAQIAVKSMTKGTTDTITYKSGSKKVAKVNKFGVITAKKKGKAVIQVKCGKVTKKVKVTVK